MIAPALIDVPEVVETARLILRCPRPGDGARLNAAIHESLAELRPWMRWVNPPPSVEETETHLRQSQANFIRREGLQYLIFLKDGETAAGSTGFHNLDWAIPSLEIGYWVRSRFAGQGYVTEAVKALSEMAFIRLGARRIQLVCDSANTRSAAVAYRAGFQLEGVLRNVSRRPVSAEICDEMVFSRVQNS